MKNNIPKLLNDKGVTAIIVALLLTVFLGIAALAVDIGYNVMVKNQLQNAADAAALAGARQLGKIYKDLTPAQMDAQRNASLSTENQNLVINAAKNTASTNKAAGASVILDDADVIIGTWNASTKTVTSGNFPLAVQVRARNNDISTFFARIFGKNKMGLDVVATANLTSQCTGNKTPFTISHTWFEPNNCPTDYLTWDGIGGGTAQDSSGANVTFSDCIAWRGNKQDVLPVMKCIAGISGGDCSDSQVDAYIPYSNGTIDNLFDKNNPNDNTLTLLALFDQMKKDEDNNPTTPDTWTTEVEISDFRCGLGNGKDAKIWGYGTITISDVMLTDPNPPYHEMRAIRFTSDCQHVQDGRGGGCNGPNIGDIPSLVQ